MALDRRKSVWLVLAALVLAAVLGLAWADGGERPLSPMEAPATLPEVGP